VLCDTDDIQQGKVLCDTDDIQQGKVLCDTDDMYIVDSFTDE